MKRFLVLLLACIMLISVFAGCTSKDSQSSQKQETTTQTSKTDQQPQAKGPFPIVKDKITLKVMGNKSPNHGPWEEMEVFKMLEELTNVHLEFDTPDSSAYYEKLMLAFNTGDLPDFFLNAGLAINVIETYGPQGSLIPLEDLIEPNAPKTKQFLDEMPQVRKDITSLDGHIYTLPNVTLTKTSGAWKVQVNTKWLEKLNLQMPKTTDEFYNILKAFKESDPNGNGQADEIPITYTGTTIFDGWLLPAFGVVMSSPGADYIALKDGKVEFGALNPGYKEYLMYMNKLYSEKLIDNEIFSQTYEQFLAKGKADLLGVLTTPPTVLVGPDKYSDYIFIPPLTSSLNSKQILPGIDITQPGAFAISNVSKYPNETMKWVDMFFRDEKDDIEGVSGLTIWLGIQGKHWNYIDTQKTKYKRLFTPPEGQSHIEHLLKTITLGWGIGKMISNAVPEGDPYMMYVANENDKGLRPFEQPIYSANIRFTKEESEKLTVLQNDIVSYVRQMSAKFITGEESFNNWDNFVNTLKRMNVDEYVQIKQTAFDRYNAN